MPFTAAQRRTKSQAALRFSASGSADFGGLRAFPAGVGSHRQAAIHARNREGSRADTDAAAFDTHHAGGSASPASRALAVAWCPASSSMPSQSRPSCLAASSDEPEPANGSSTGSPGAEIVGTSSIRPLLLY